MKERQRPGGSGRHKASTSVVDGVQAQAQP